MTGILHASSLISKHSPQGRNASGTLARGGSLVCNWFHFKRGIVQFPWEAMRWPGMEVTSECLVTPWLGPVLCYCRRASRPPRRVCGQLQISALQIPDQTEKGPGLPHLWSELKSGGNLLGQASVPIPLQQPLPEAGGRAGIRVEGWTACLMWQGHPVSSGMSSVKWRIRRLVGAQKGGNSSIQSEILIYSWGMRILTQWVILNPQK